MQKRTYAGFGVVVENPTGSVRQWYDRAAGKSGETVMKHDYGYLEGHVGTDGDEVDVYLGPDEQAPFVHVVHQLAAPEFKRHDEDKVLLGFRSEADAKAAYLAHRSDGESAYGGMSVIPLEAFKAKLGRRSGTGKIRHEASMKKRPLIQFDFQRGPDGKVRTGVWDRVCVPTAVPDQKDGEATQFTVENMSQMVDNFVGRGDMIPMDWNHQSNYAKTNGQPAPALAFYGALAVVADGKIVKADGTEGLDLSRDGLWAYRCEVTEMGEQLLAGFKYLSPTFTPEGEARDGTPIGYSLAAVAATNTPFQEGTQITFENQPAGAQPAQPKEGRMAKLAHVAKLLKMEGDADDAAVKHALEEKMDDAAMDAAAPPEGFDYAGHAAKLEELAQAYEDAHMEEGEDAEPPHQIMRKMAAHARKMAKLEEPADEGEKKEPEMAKHDEAPEAKMDKDEDKDAKMEAMQATITGLSTRLAKFEKNEAEREKAAKLDREKTFSKLADDAVAGGYPKEKRAALVAFARSDFEAARSTVEHFLPKTGAPAQLFERMTAQGAPIDGKTSARAGVDVGPKAPRKVKAMGINFVEEDGELADEIEKVADSKDPVLMERVNNLLLPTQRGEKAYRLMAAEKIVRADRPDLAEQAE